MYAAAIIESLEQVSEICGDPYLDIYTILLDRYPDMTSLFILDKNYEVRKAMMQACYECIFDYAEGGNLYVNMIIATRYNHSGYGVPDDMFDKFFPIMQEYFRTQLADKWLDKYEAAWRIMLEKFEQCR